MAGEFFVARLDGNQGDELGGVRPVLLIRLVEEVKTVMVLPLEEDRGQQVPAETVLGNRLPRLVYSWLSWRKALVRVECCNLVQGIVRESGEIDAEAEDNEDSTIVRLLSLSIYSPPVLTL